VHFSIFATILSFIEGAIQLPSGVARTSMRGIGNFLLSGVWRLLGLPDPNDGLVAFAEAVISKLGASGIVSTDQLQAAIVNLIKELQTVSGKGTVNLANDLLAELETYLASPDGWKAVLGWIQAAANGGNVGAAKEACAYAAAAGKVNWSGIAGFVEKLIPIAVAILTHVNLALPAATSTTDTTSDAKASAVVSPTGS